MNKAKAARAFLRVRGFIFTPPKLRFDGKSCTFVKQSFGSVKFERPFQVRPSLHNRERVRREKVQAIEAGTPSQAEILGM